MRRLLNAIGPAILTGSLVAAPAAAQEQGEASDFEGSVEMLVRNVSQDGSLHKYDEDFDGLDSGVRLSGLSAKWSGIDARLVDFLRLEASGLGGDPYERINFGMGRKDRYDLNVTYRSQAQLYNLFDQVDDMDGSTWDGERSVGKLDLTWHLSETTDLFVEFQDVRRDGSSLFMKNINADLFRLETPLDQTTQRYAVGGRFRLGPADLFFRQTLQHFDYRFDNSTTDNAGLSLTDLATLNAYDWRQDDSGDANLTTLTVSLPLGNRVHLTASAFGTLLGEEEITSKVSLEADGTSVSGTPYSVTDGASRAKIEADHQILDADLAVEISDPLEFHLRIRSLDREITGNHLRDLDGNGTADDTEGTVGDTTPGSRTRVDYSLDSITGLFDYMPTPKLRLRAGYRTIDREVDRSGFEYSANDVRNTDYESSDDETLILGVVLKPTRWLRLDADYEEGDIAQPFTAVAARETDRLRLRATFRTRTDMRLDLSYLDYENTNHAVDFRQAGDCSAPGSDVDDGCWDGTVDGTSYAASFRHRANPRLDYWLRWAQQDHGSVIRVHYDTDFFNGSDNGNSVHDDTRTEWSGQANFNWAEPWRGFVRFRVNDSDGDSDLAGLSPLIIDQDYSDLEAGLTYTFTSGLYVGGRYRVFDYDDENNRLDYDGEILSIVAGLDF